MDKKSDKWWLLWGSIPQHAMLLSFIACLVFYGDMSGFFLRSFSAYRLIDLAGSAIFLYCLVVLYVQGRGLKGLITTGPFKYTRHPMYTGILLMDTVFWLPTPISLNFGFILLQLTFLTSLITAGWFQEKETLARFGDEAEAYYRRTPRLFFMYPFRSRAA